MAYAPTRVSGADGVFTIAIDGGSVVAVGALQNWEVDYEQGTVDASAAGDTVDRVEPIRKRWTARFEALLAVANPYVFPSTLLGLACAFAAKVSSAHTNGLLAGTGLGRNLNFTLAHDNMVRIRGEIVSNGADLTIDTSPAT
jgi:hypothetical protein